MKFYLDFILSNQTDEGDTGNTDRKQEAKRFLSVDDIILYLKDQKDCTRSDE